EKSDSGMAPRPFTQSSMVSFSVATVCAIRSLPTLVWESRGLLRNYSARQRRGRKGTARDNLVPGGRDGMMGDGAPCKQHGRTTGQIKGRVARVLRRAGRARLPGRADLSCALCREEIRFLE